MPIMTAPLPIGCTSPPSTCARPQSSSAPPSQVVELLGREHRMEAVDRLDDHRLRLAGRLRHRVDRDAVVDPARRVALEQEVRQRREQHARRVGRLPHEPDVLFDVGLGDAADQEVRDLRRLGRLDPLAGALRGGDADLALVEDVVAHPVLHLGLDQRLGEQLLGLEHLDAALAHHLAEHVVLGLGAADPQHVVEQQLLGVRRRQRRVLEARPVDHDLAQLADLGMDAERHGDLLAG